MHFFAYTVLVVYTLALTYITVYCLFQFNLLYYYKKGHQHPFIDKKKNYLSEKSPALAEKIAVNKKVEAVPFVTIQLPIFNEMYVVERLIDNITQFNYPKDRFEIQVLDDSTDQTVDISRAKVEEYQGKGFQIELITRTDRKGYKAGALKEATKEAKGDFIAIFDADFLPRPDFLNQTIPYFEDDKIGVVQTRWEHINEDYSLITRLQALQLNVHFRVEQSGRMFGQQMLQFNGTAGVWRKKTIEDAGGWEADTLTEDLDLSIRAQLKGWKIHFLEEIGSPAELPIEMNSLKSQQFRWMKGGAETAKKMLPTIWKSDLNLKHKISSTIHLMASSIFLFVFVAGVFSVPLLFSLGELFNVGFNKNFFGYFLIGLLSVIIIYYVANVQAELQPKENPVKKILKFILLFPLFLSLSMGLSLHNSIAVLQGFRGKRSPFIRTPKFNIKSINDSIASKKYLTKKISWITIFEGVLALYFLAAIIGAIYVQNTTFIIFHLMLFIGYAGIFYFTVRHLRMT